EMRQVDVSAKYPNYYAIVDYTRVEEGYIQYGRVHYLCEEGEEALDVRNEVWDTGVKCVVISGDDLAWKL
ncbi:MAG: hypothetical protein FWG65_01205, partial [Turicibacter sp.]|nr:hypothetical protein [Turicibacter sp.]